MKDSISDKRNVVLTGMPGCGKSVTGVVLAKSLNKSFVDTDLLIQEREGRSLQDIINKDGTERFKEIEREVLVSLDTENTVIATGGSAVYYPDAMEHLREGGDIIYIEAPLEVIEKRLKNIKTRGVAMEKGQSIAELYASREPLYRKYADITVMTDRGSVERTVEKMIDALRAIQRRR